MVADPRPFAVQSCKNPFLQEIRIGLAPVMQTFKDPHQALGLINGLLVRVLFKCCNDFFVALSIYEREYLLLLHVKFLGIGKVAIQHLTVLDLLCSGHVVFINGYVSSQWLHVVDICIRFNCLPHQWEVVFIHMNFDFFQCFGIDSKLVRTVVPSREHVALQFGTCTLKSLLLGRTVDIVVVTITLLIILILPLIIGWLLVDSNSLDFDFYIVGAHVWQPQS
jgi:hypothetical protein